MKRSIEVLEIKEYSYPQTTKRNIKNINYYNEKTPIVYTKSVIQDNISTNELVQLTTKEFEKTRKSIEKAFHEYALLKLFYRAIKPTDSFNKQFLSVEKFLNRLKQDYEKLLKYLNELKKFQPEREIYIDVYYKLVELNIIITGINDEIKELQDNYYPEMKVTVYNLCNDKTAKELEELNDNVNNYLKEFKNIQEAFDYICYNSGPLISDTVSSFVESLKANGRSVSIEYFLDSDVVIAFNYIEWVNLMKRIKFIKAKFRNDNYSLTFMENYKNLEVSYAIILIFNAAVENNER